MTEGAPTDLPVSEPSPSEPLPSEPLPSEPSSPEVPPAGLPGLDPAWSRVVVVPQSAARPRTDGSGGSADGSDGPDGSDPAVPDAVGRLTPRWHVLDNAADLETLGATPVGTLLCVHGNPTWSYLWRDVLAAATAQAADGGPAWRVVAVDQLDMGFSERTAVPRPLPRRVRDLGDLTDALGLDGPVVTVGHDWGGVVSLGWAVDHPEQLRGVVLLNTAVHHPTDVPIPAPLRLALGVLRPGTVTTPAFLETTLALARPALAPAVKEAFRAPYRTPDRRHGIGAFVADIPADEHHPSRAELDRIADGVRDLGVPALILWGARDPVFGDRHLRDLMERLPHADVHRYERAGHLVAEDIDLPILTWLSTRDLPGAAPTPATPSADRLRHSGSNPQARSGGLEQKWRPRRGGHTEVRGGRAEARDGGHTEAWGDAGRRPLWEVLDERSAADPRGVALVEMAPPAGDAPRVVSWGLLARRVRELAAGLHASGVRAGDRISLLVPPGADLTAVLYACLRIGAVVVVADAGLGVRGLGRAVRGAHPDVVIGARKGLAAARALGWPGRRVSTTPLPAGLAAALGVDMSLLDVAELGALTDLPAEPGPDDHAAVLFTSGSTGPAKGVAYTHAQLAAMRDALAAQYDIGPGTGLVAGFAPFALLGPALGTRSVTPDMDVTAPRTLTAPAVAAAVAAADATVLFLSPAALTNVVATAGDLTPDDHAALAGVRTFLSAGAPVPVPLLAAAGDLIPNAVAHTPYGMTEGLLMTDITLDEIRDAGADPASAGPGGVCVGRPATGVTVRISALGDDGAATGEPADTTGVTGEIVVSAPHLKDHYDRLWATDLESRRGLPGPRWHRTGDVGHLDAHGRLWVEGRLAHVLRTADGVLTPVGPEQRAEEVPGVRRAAVVGVGPAGTQQVVVVVETEPGVRGAGLADGELTAAVRRAVVGQPGPQGGAADGGAVGSAGGPDGGAVGCAGGPDSGTALAPAPVAVLSVPRLPTDVRHNSKIDRARVAAWADGVLAGGRMGEP